MVVVSGESMFLLVGSTTLTSRESVESYGLIVAGFAYVCIYGEINKTRDKHKQAESYNLNLSLCPSLLFLSYFWLSNSSGCSQVDHSSLLQSFCFSSSN